MDFCGIARIVESVYTAIRVALQAAMSLLHPIPRIVLFMLVINFYLTPRIIKEKENYNALF